MSTRLISDEGTEADQALENVDQALDMILACLKVIDSNLPLIQTENVPQKAALDNIKETLEKGVKPYMSDMVKDFSYFD